MGPALRWSHRPHLSHFLWLMERDYKVLSRVSPQSISDIFPWGWMPQSILDVAMPVAQIQLIENIRKLAEKLKSEGKF